MKKHMDEILETLGNNLNLKLSLSSRELYHSNFIAYIISQNKDLPLIFLDGHIENINSLTVKYVAREEKKSDITLTLSDDSKIVIENKVKDYPKREQLERYTQKHPDSSKFLLAPFIPTSSVIPSEWKVIRYNDIVRYLKMVLEKTKPKFSVFIEDYIELCELLELLFNQVNTDINSSIYCETEEILHKLKVRDLRLDSVIERISRNSLLNSIEADFTPYSGRARGKFFFGGLVQLDEYFSIDVQIEGYDYRHKLNIAPSKVNNNAFKATRKLKQEKLLYNFDSRLKESNKQKEWGQYGLGRLDKSFDFYNEKIKTSKIGGQLDIYDYKKIPKDIKNIDLIKMMNTDLQYFQDNKEKILKTLYDTI